MSNRNSIGSVPLDRFAIFTGLLALFSALSLTGCTWDPATAAKVSSDTSASAGDQKSAADSTPVPPGSSKSAQYADADPAGDAAHMRLYANSRFPSATACGKCHPTQYRQWSVSQHAYAQLSPIFNAMQGKINEGLNGTIGDFCIRCHTQAGMNLGESTFMSNIDRSPTSREGISCVICHRVAQRYGKVSGRLALNTADITSPILGPTGNNDQLQKAIEAAGLQTDPSKPGRKVHAELKKFFAITTSAFCGTCHDVNLANGFRLEEAFSEYKHSPAALRGIQCQDCHMGKEAGRVLAERSDPDFFQKNYNFGPAARVGGFETAPRKLTDHRFAGPDYSVLPPSLFPLNIAAVREESERNDPNARGLATIREWMEFDWKAGWGCDEFESKVAAEDKFPPRWATENARRDGRRIVDQNIKLLGGMREQRLKVLRNGYRLGDIKVEAASGEGIAFTVQVKNGTDGHGVPTGFDAERLTWVHVIVRDADGRAIKESGDLDPNGDVRDLNSTYVKNRELPEDEELFSLQSHFIDRMQRGSEKEQILATNLSLGPLPFLRPSRFSAILTGRPFDARKQRHNIEPLGEGIRRYTVEKSQLTGRAPYTAHVELKSAMVPVNLVNEVRTVGFDYNLSANRIARELIAGHVVLWEQDVVLLK